MHSVDWLIVIVPILVVLYIALRAQRYVKGVADFLAAGRVAGRYVLAVSAGEAAFGLISLAAVFEFNYNSGFALMFWYNAINVPVVFLMALTGYCIYRFRESRAMTMGQFLEMRYSRRFRIAAGCLQSFSGVMNYAIFPAVGARFLIYFCDLPLQVNLFGLLFPTFGVVMMFFLGLAVFLVCMGGQITIMVTDCIQGILSYPFYAIVVGYVLLQFPFFSEVGPTLSSRGEGESMLNPYDIEKLRNFNIFYILVGVFGSILNRMSWSGNQGYSVAALNAHEQKMGGVLGHWRQGFSGMMIILLVAVGYTFLNNPKYADEAKEVRSELAAKVVQDVSLSKGPLEPSLATDIDNYLATGVPTRDFEQRLRGEEYEQALSNVHNEPERELVKQAIAAEAPDTAQTFSTIYGQGRMPATLRAILPIGITGLFCALCIFLLISTDTTYMHSWGSIIVQDIIMPLRGKPLTPKQHLRLLRVTIAGVAVFAFFFSFFFSQVDYILMFFAITAVIWTGGAGPCIVGGLYWKKGTTAGAFTALIVGSSIGVSSIIAQKIWVPVIYPWLEKSGHSGKVASILESFSAPFEPFIMWRLTADKFPINSQEILFLSMLLSIGLYVGVSLLTCRKDCNMDRLLHRGQYRVEGDEIEKRPKLTILNAVPRFLGITSEYTLGDKILAWASFGWSFGWVLGTFIVIFIWNIFSPWPIDRWVLWFAIFYILVGGLKAIISTVWFTVGGTVDLRRLFKRLEDLNENVLDDGRVVEGVSAQDVSRVENVEHVNIEEAHREEALLKEALEAEHDIDDLEDLERRTKDDTELK